jgi:hypothetical protein
MFHMHTGMRLCFMIWIVSKKCKFYVQGSVLHEYMSITVQQDATMYSLFISVNCSTCFRWYLHPSSGADITVYTASGISVTAMDRIESLLNK